MVLTTEEKLIDDEIKEQSLHIKFSKQLTEMFTSHENKYLELKQELDDLTKWLLHEFSKVRTF